eukprot:Opistho-2@19159
MWKMCTSGPYCSPGLLRLLLATAFVVCLVVDSSHGVRYMLNSSSTFSFRLPYPKNANELFVYKAAASSNARYVSFTPTLLDIECGWDYVYLEASGVIIGGLSGTLANPRRVIVNATTAAATFATDSDCCDVMGGVSITSTLSLCPLNCSLNGVCVGGSCKCNSGFIGLACEQQACPSNCSGHGTCLSVGCDCHEGFTGEACDAPLDLGVWSTVAISPYLAGCGDSKRRDVRSRPSVAFFGKETLEVDRFSAASVAHSTVLSAPNLAAECAAAGHVYGLPLPNATSSGWALSTNVPTADAIGLLSRFAHSAVLLQSAGVLPAGGIEGSASGGAFPSGPSLWLFGGMSLDYELLASLVRVNVTSGGLRCNPNAIQSCDSVAGGAPLTRSRCLAQ